MTAEENTHLHLEGTRGRLYPKLWSAFLPIFICDNPNCRVDALSTETDRNLKSLQTSRVFRVLRLKTNTG